MAWGYGPGAGSTRGRYGPAAGGAYCVVGVGVCARPGPATLPVKGYASSF